MSFLIKICGITRPEDAAYAATLGVDAIGVNLWKGSKRFVDDNRAREIVAAVPASVIKVAVYVNAHPLVVTDAFTDLGVDRVQLHGTEKVAEWSEIPREKLIRAIRVEDESSLKEALTWDAGLFIYDAFSEGFGGSGKVAPWNLITETATRPFLLAGGLDPMNVGDAIAATRPNGVDIASGVEKEPGVKDRAKMAAFVEAARNAAKKLKLG